MILKKGELFTVSEETVICTHEHRLKIGKVYKLIEIRPPIKFDEVKIGVLKTQDLPNDEIWIYLDKELEKVIIRKNV